MTAIFYAAFLLLIPLLAGAVVLASIGIRPRHDPLGYAGWAYLAGSVAVAAALFIGAVVGRGLVPLLGLAVIFYGLELASEYRQAAEIRQAAKRGRRVASSDAVPAPIRRGPFPERLFFAVMVGICLVVVGDRMLQADARAVIGQDEAHIWAAKAKVLYAAAGEGGDLNELLASESIVYHQDYPLLNPLLQLGTFFLAGDVVHAANRVPIQGFFVALVLALAAALRRVVRPAAAAVLLWLVVTVPISRMLISQAVADHMVALGLLVTMDAWWRYRQTGGRPWWRLAVVALAFTAWSKNEGLVIAALVVAALILDDLASRFLRGRAVAPSPPPIVPAGQRRWLLLPAVTVLAQLGFNAYYDLSGDLVGTGLVARLLDRFAEHAPVVARAFADKLLLEPRATQLLAATMVLLAVLFPRRLARAGMGAFAAVLAATVAVYFLIYCATPYDVDWHLRTSLERILFHLIPAAALWIAAAASIAMPGWRGIAAEDAVTSAS